MEIEVLLTRRRMSGAALAKALGVSQPYVWRRLTGETSLDLSDIERIAAVLDIEPVDLLRAASTSPTLQYPDSSLIPSARPALGRPRQRTDSRRPTGGRPERTRRPVAARHAA